MLLEERIDDEDGDLKSHENLRLLEKGMYSNCKYNRVITENEF